MAPWLVGGGIISHTVPWLHYFTEETVVQAEHIPTVGSIIGAVTPTLINFGIGLVAGAIVLIIVTLLQKLWSKKASA